MSRHLFLLDGSKAAEEVLPHAVSLSRALGAELHLLHVMETGVPSALGAVDSVAWRMKRAEADAYLTSWRQRLERHGVRVATELREGRVEDEVADAARARDVDLVVLARTDAGGGPACEFGEGAQRVVAGVGVSFFLARPTPSSSHADGRPAYRRVLVPLDASQRAECALPMATAVARAHGATLLLAHVAPVPELPGPMPPTDEDVRLRERVVDRNRARGGAYLEEVRRRLTGPGLEVETRVIVAPDVGRAIHRAVRDEGIDLVVASAHGSGCGGSHALPTYGCVARELIGEATVPVWVVQDLPRHRTPPAAQAPRVHEPTAPGAQPAAPV